MLALAGTDKTRILTAQIWLADMATFAEMNAVWDTWVPQGHTPARATGEAKLATPDYKVEIIVTAALALTVGAGGFTPPAPPCGYLWTENGRAQPRR